MSAWLWRGLHWLGAVVPGRTNVPGKSGRRYVRLGGSAVGCASRVGSRTDSLCGISDDLPEALSSPSFLFADDLKIVNSSSKADDLTTYLQAAALLAT